jgi:hypothetical protein
MPDNARYKEEYFFVLRKSNFFRFQTQCVVKYVSPDNMGAETRREGRYR